MTLRRKTFALFLMLGLSLLLGSYVVLRTAVYPTFEEFEHESSRQAVKRVIRMLDEDLRALQIMNTEYSMWDPTYKYANGSQPGYVAENLEPHYWRSIGVNLLAIYDAAGNELYTWMIDRDNVAGLSFRDELTFELRPGHPLIHHEAITDSRQGLLQTRSGLMQVVSRPILKGNGLGPIAGTVIVGQHLSAARLQNLGARATVELSLAPISDKGGRRELARWGQDSTRFDNGTLVETDADSVRGYAILTDIFDAPAAVLEVLAPPRISRIGAATIRSTMLAMAGASAVFLLAALLFLQRLITMPVTSLTRQILRMGDSGEFAWDVGESRADEIGTLAREFAALTRRLGDAMAELEHARDAAVAMSKTKSEFLARMSHEIRTPMNGVLGMTELLRETALDARQQRFASTIHQSAEALLNIINDILDIAKIESGKIVLDIAPFNLRSLVEECLDLLAESAHGKGLELACSYSPDASVYVRGDAARLRQILINLVGNALKFTEHGEVIVRVTQLGCDAEQANFRFEVVDTGIGISADNASKIFEPFVQEDGSNTRRHGGTGLGLAISKQLAELMGGEIGVTSMAGNGSTFWVTVRLAEDDVTDTLTDSNLLTGKTVLVVDDNQTNRDILRHQLESWNMHVLAAGSGSEALHILGSETDGQVQVDIMLLDMAMPAMNGLELARVVRNGHYRHVPIVMLSSISRTNVEHEYSAEGPADWIAKPVRQSRLYDCLVSHLGGTASVALPAKPQAVVGRSAANDAHSGLRVLVVDDNDVNLAVAVAMLNSLGHVATTATSGREALAACELHEFDAILMDCRMPEMDGYAATQEIRKLEERLGRKRLPIVAVTAHSLQGDRERCIAAGMDDYLAKPFTKQQLLSALDANVRADASHTPQPPPTPKLRILVVDDNVVNQQVNQAMLASLGYQCVAVSDGDQALDALERGRFDLIMMDCHMPVRNGYDTTEEIRRREAFSGQTRRTPVIAVTADFMERNRQQCLDAGMDDYILKPFTQEQLRAVLRRWLIDPGNAATASIDSDGFTRFGDTQIQASIDRETLDELRRLDTSPGAAILRDIVIAYCASSTKLMLQIRNAIADRNTELVEQLAHSLKGSSGQLGAILLAALCEDMIASAIGNDLERLRTQSERAAVEHCAVLECLDRELQSVAA